MRRRSYRLLGSTLRFALFAVAGVAAARYFLDAISVEGWGPRAFLGLLLIVGGLSLAWRGYADLRQSVRRYRS